MLVSMKTMLQDACRENYAVGNFDVFNVEMIKGVMKAACETRSPVILAFAEAFEQIIPIDEFAQMAKRIAWNASVPVALHLDHANNFNMILRALRCGFTSVMVDMSDKPLEENIAFTNKVNEICRVFDASLEAELGHVGGLEGQYEAADYDDECAYTTVKEAERFVNETGVDALAVAIGTVHGVYKSEPKLDLVRLKELKQALKMPLVLHGGSGLSDLDLKACVNNGINKINIFTDLTIAAMRCLSGGFEGGYLDKSSQVIDAVAVVAKERMTVLNSIGKV